MRVLVLTHRLPYAPDRGDRIRAYHLLRSLAQYAEVDLVSFVHDADEMRHARDLDGLAHVTVVPVPRLRNALRALLSLAGSRPLTHLLLDSPEMPQVLRRLVRDRSPDVTLAYCSGMARFALVEPLADHPLVLDLVDVDSAKWEQLADGASWPKKVIYRREARTLARFERAAAEAARATLVVNERERECLLRLVPGRPVHVVPNGIDVAAFAPLREPSDSATVVFCGVMDYEPNVAAVSWFCGEVWPLVRARRPDARFQAVGSSPPRAVRRLARPDSGIEVTGRVPSVQPYLWGAAAAVAPLRVARGIQNKVLEALAAGLPTVVTTAVFDGLPAEVRAGCIRADAPAAVAEAVLGLLSSDPADRRRIAGRADVSRLGWAQRLKGLRPLLEGAAGSPRVGR